jgi:hypothetical protein
MNKTLKIVLIVVGLIALVLGADYLFAHRCEEPDPVVIVLTQLGCAQKVDVDAFRKTMCMELYRNVDCEFQESDKEHLQQSFLNIVNKCTDEELKLQNLCTGNVKKLTPND